MRMHCFGCGVEKDTDVLEVSPFADADGLTTDPIGPLFVLDCQGPPIPNSPDKHSEYRMVVVCHTCFHALEPDMWISKNCWDSIQPKVPYEKLPDYVSGLHDPTKLRPLP